MTETRQRGLSMREIRPQLQARIRALVMELAPPCAGAWSSPGIYTPLNPTRADRNPGSFVIWLKGDMAGSFREYAGADDPSNRGDVFDLIAYVHMRPRDRKFARQWALNWLGLSGSPEAQKSIRAQRDKMQAAAKQREQKDERERLKKMLKDRKSVLGWWLNAERDIRGTPVETYLKRCRGIDLDKLPRHPGALRYLPDAVHKKTGEILPCMFALATGPDGTAWAAHRTFLKPDGSDKADVSPARLIWPKGWDGSAVRISAGKHKCSPEAAAKKGLTDELLLAEGIEDALSLAMSEHNMRIWATLTLGNLAKIILPASCEAVFISADNDWARPQASAALDKAVTALKRQGRPVHVLRSPIGKDFNDVVQMEKEMRL